MPLDGPVTSCCILIQLFLTSQAYLPYEVTKHWKSQVFKFKCSVVTGSKLCSEVDFKTKNGLSNSSGMTNLQIWDIWIFIFGLWIFVVVIIPFHFPEIMFHNFAPVKGIAMGLFYFYWKYWHKCKCQHLIHIFCTCP